MNTTIVLSLSALVLAACSCSSGVNLTSSSQNGNNTSNESTTGLVFESETINALTARHRNGQTFLMWPEVSSTANYNVYRHNRPITQSNLDDATLLNSRWGALDSNTSLNRSAVEGMPTHYVVDNLSLPLSDSTGLFVHTIAEEEQANSYYAVTSIVNGSENRNLRQGGNSLRNSVQENRGRPKPVLTASINEGKGRVYTHYMNYAEWNPTMNGYAYSYAVSLPHNFDAAISYPLQLRLHAYSGKFRFLPETEFRAEMIQISPMDIGHNQQSIHSWWYGYSADHDYSEDSSIPNSGVISNFTEQRVLQSIQDLIEDPSLNINTDLIHIVGHSMGASGALSFGLRYPSLFSGIYASEPMTNYITSPLFQDEFEQLWGSQSSNLPIQNKGVFSNNISNYDINGSMPTGVWDWMNHQEQMQRRSADDFAFLAIDHGKSDTIIDWETQGRPLTRALTRAKLGFTANAFEGIGHVWLSFGAVIRSLFGLGFADESEWRYPNSLSFPAISNATGSANTNPGTIGDSSYNTNIIWSTVNTSFDRDIVDSPNQYQISLRSTIESQTASITPRNTNSFRPIPQTMCVWSVSQNSNNQLIQSGSATVDRNGLITVDQVSILPETGVRLTIDC